MTMLLTSIAVILTELAVFLPFAMYANTEASLAARHAVFLWLGSAAGACWYFAYVGAC